MISEYHRLHWPNTDRSLVSTIMAVRSRRMVCLLLIVVLGTCVHEGLSIKCFECTSDIDPSCGDPIDNTSLPIIDCKFAPDLPHLPGVRPTLCRKTFQKVRGVSKIFRGCGYLDDRPIAEDGQRKSCWTDTSKDKIFEEYCTCDDRDGCNAGPTVYSTQFIILFAAVTTWLMNRF